MKRHVYKSLWLGLWITRLRRRRQRLLRLNSTRRSASHRRAEDADESRKRNEAWTVRKERAKWALYHHSKPAYMH
jgi:hypothetical protein